MTLVTPLIWGDQPILSTLSKRLFRHIRHIKTASQEALSCNCRSVEPVEVSREDFFDRFRRPSQGQKVRQTRGQMPCIGETAHIRSNLGQDHFCEEALDPWDRRESLDLVLIRVASSSVSMSASCSLKRKQWCGLMCPWRAYESRSRLERILPSASSAKTAGSTSPANKAVSMSRADLPITSTLDRSHPHAKMDG